MSVKFKPAGSRAARRTIEAAFKDLDQTITPIDSRDFPDTTLQHVRKAALDIENQLAARQSLRNMRRLMPLFEGLEHYAKVVDVLCNGTPFLPWIWAPITLILRIAIDHVKAFEIILEGYSRIAESLVRFDALKAAFRDNHEFQQTVAVFYADVLQFHKYAYTFVRRNSWKLLFLTSWGRFQRRFDGIVSDLEHHGKLIDREASARHIVESQRWREGQQERLTRHENEQANKQYRHIASWLNADGNEQLSIHELASSEGAKYPGTCTWLMKNQKLLTWPRSDTDSYLCWLQGVPGAGKTVLLARILAFIKADSRIVVSHFINNTYSSTKAYDQILRSLLLQFLRQDEDLTAFVYNKYVMARRMPTVSGLEQLLKTLFTTTSHEPRTSHFLWILIDGLECCESSTQASVINLIKQLVSKNPHAGGTVCKFLIASRTTEILAKRISKTHIISLTEEMHSLNLAIREYASVRMDNLRDRFDELHLTLGDLEDIKGAIVRKADGLFIYARLILDYVGRKIFFSGAEVRQSVHQLPPELSDFYQSLLARIIAPLDKVSVKRVGSLFGWLAFAKRPMKRLELLSAVTFSSSDHTVSHLVPDYILTVCGPLVEERPDTTLSFIHSTVKEFLQNESLDLKLNHAYSRTEHGIASITCLRAGMRIFRSNLEQQSKPLRVVSGLHGFQIYATDHWVDYLLEATEEMSSQITDATIYQLAVALAAEANEVGSYHPQEGEDRVSNELNDRSKVFPDAELRLLVFLTLRSRTPEALHSQLYSPTDPDGIFVRRERFIPATVLQAALEDYQSIVKYLFEKSNYSGISSEELQRFRQQFRNSVFTCRLGACPSATIGFESEFVPTIRVCARDEESHEQNPPRRPILRHQKKQIGAPISQMEIITIENDRIKDPGFEYHVDFEYLPPTSYDELVEDDMFSGDAPDYHTLQGLIARLRTIYDIIEDRAKYCERGILLAAYDMREMELEMEESESGDMSLTGSEDEYPWAMLENENLGIMSENDSSLILDSQ